MGKPFKELARSLMNEYLSWDPSFATQVGWHKYDHVLRDPSSNAAEHVAERCRELVEELREIPAKSLSDLEAIDRDLAIYILELKSQYGMDLGPQTEALYEFAIRKAKEAGT